MQYERRTTWSSGRPARTRTDTVPSAATTADASTTGRRPHGVRAVAQGRRAAPPPPPSRRRARPTDVGGPGTSTSSTSKAGAAAPDRLGDARRARHPDDARAVAPHAGRHRRALGPEAHRVLAGVEHPDGPTVLIGQAAGHGRHLGRHLAAERAAVGQWRCRLAARRAPRRVGLDVAGLDPGGAQRAVPSTGLGTSNGQVSADRRAPPLHLPGGRRAPRPASRRPPTPRWPTARRRGHRPARCRRRSRLAPAPHGRRPVARCRPSMAARSAAAARSRYRRSGRCAAGDGERRLPDGLPAGAAAQVGEQGLVDRGRRQRPSPRRADSRTTMPGVQNPHWLAPAAVNAAAQRSASSRPSTVVTSRPATRRAGVTQATRA